MTDYKKLITFGLQPRDFKILRGFFESRVMTAAHIAALYIRGSKEAAKKRLQKLKAAGLISERKRRVNEPAVLFLTRKGFSLLTEQNLLSEYPRLSATAFEKRADVSAMTIRHELEVMDVKAAFCASLDKIERFGIGEFSTWPRLHEFKARRFSQDSAEVLVKPDGFIGIYETEPPNRLSQYTFFLEVDRSTETLDTLVNRASCYLNYYRDGGFAVRNGADPTKYKEFPFRVLFVLKNAERRNNIAKRLLDNNPPIRTMVYLSTFPEVLTNPAGAIWVRPIDYLDALGSVVSGKHISPYRRQAERDALVEDKIKKVTLFEV